MTSTSDMAADRELVRRSLAGETAAFEQLVRKHQRLVFGVALGNAGDAAVAEEVAQEAFVEAWRDLPRLRDTGRVGSWIAGIARNVARGWGRRSRRRRRHHDAIAAEAVLGAHVTTPLDAALERESRGLLRQALADIPASYREVLVLFHVQGRSIAEVAAGLGISEDLVKQRLARGRRALRSSLEHGVEDALGQLGPGKTFTTTVMIAVSSAVATKATAATSAGTAGKLISLVSSTKAIIGVAAVAAVAGAIWYRSSRANPITPPLPGPAATSPLTLTATPSAKDTPLAPSPKGARKLADAAQRERMLATIRQAQQRKQATAHAATPSSREAASPDGDLDKDYIRSSVRELLPFIQECYETLLETKPTAQGNVVVKFTIEGEPDAGGLVTESEIDPASTITDPELHDCMRETMFALEIDPPANGGKVEVVYPFSFSVGSDAPPSP